MGGSAEMYYLQFLIAMDCKHLNEVQKAFIEVMEQLEQLIVRVFDAINYKPLDTLYVLQLYYSIHIHMYSSMQT